MQSADTLMAAVRHHQAGQFAEADRLYRKVLASEPRNIHALHLRGALAHARGHNEDAVKLIGRAIAIDGQVSDFHYNIGLALWALDRKREAADHWSRAVALNPSFAQARLNLGNALRDDGHHEEAVAQHRATVQLQPQSAPAHNALGLSLAKAGHDDEAIPHYRQAIALRGDLIDAYLNLAMAHSNRGETGEAIAAVMRSIAIRETPENRTLLVQLAHGLTIEHDDPNLRHLLTRALTENWSAPGLLASACMALIRHGPASPLIARAVEVWPARLPAADLLGPAGLAGLNDPLLLALMDSTVLHDEQLEKFLSACRAALLDTAEAASPDGSEALLGFASALARQCFINEYVYAAAEDEEARAQRLHERLDAALASNAPVPPLWVAAVACYAPLHQLAHAQALHARSWPAPIAPLLAQQVRAPQEEAALRAGIRQLTPIGDGVSQAVQAQYEANPYPRWIRMGKPRSYASLDAYLRELLPAAMFRPSAKTGRLDILVAGCGTGQHAILTAQQHEGARTLAIDLSRASLAYAAAKTRELKVEGLDYAQADIMRLGSLKQRFGLIESVGVLHHLADPYAGWRVLKSLLRPGGFMRIALYSEIGRWGIVDARTRIAEAGHGAGATEIRRFRSDVMQRDDEAARNIMGFPDFYSTSECRDLLFHTQEHRMTLPAIRDFLAAERLNFLGFEIDRATARQYGLRFPADTAMTDLDQWHAFEQDNTRTFESMYRFWVQSQP